MFKMNQGEFGRVVEGDSYAGEIVYCEADKIRHTTMRIVSLTVKDRWWSNADTIGGVRVEILPKGTIISITV